MKSVNSSPLSVYIPLVEFLGNAIGSHCEVVLHDVQNIESSIIAIKNNHVSKRNVGGSLTDLALKILKNQELLENDYLLNYSGKTQEGKLVRSSTFFIRNETEEVIGMLCFNMDISQMVEARDLINNLINGGFGDTMRGLQMHGKNLDDEGCLPIEDLHTSIENLTTSIIIKTLAEFDVEPIRMSPEEKIAVVKKLNVQGVFLIKGAVPEVANYLKTSEATVYRYLKNIEMKQLFKNTNEVPL